MDYKGCLHRSPTLLEQTAGAWEGKSGNIYQRLDVRYALDTNGITFPVMIKPERVNTSQQIECKTSLFKF